MCSFLLSLGAEMIANDPKAIAGQIRRTTITFGVPGYAETEFAANSLFRQTTAAPNFAN